MTCKIVSKDCNWNDVLNVCRNTVGKEPIDKEPSSSWKKKLLLAEHSPIRLLKVRGRWENIMSWVSVHFTRHWLGIIHFVKSQRTDKTGIDRGMITQNAGVNHDFEANAQAIINISRKRLCYRASEETRNAWAEFVTKLWKEEPELAAVCVPECIYRGFCPEFENGCKRIESVAYKFWLDDYRQPTIKEGKN